MTTYYLIRNKSTGKFVYRTAGAGRTRYSYVDGAGDASLIRTGSAATLIVQNLDRDMTGSRRYLARRAEFYAGAHEVIKVNVLIFPVGTQPFIDGVLNGKP